MNIKRIIAAGVAVLVIYVTAFAGSQVRVYVNGSRVNQDAIISENRTFIPLRAVSEALGAEVTWDAESRSAYVKFTEDDAIAKVVEDVSQSVVTIIGNYDGKGSSVEYNNPTMHGTGVIYKNNGHIITNAHVVKDIKNLTVVLSNGESYPGTVLFSDEDADLAIVKINKLGLKPIAMADKKDVISGKTAIAIGTPISLSMRNTVTKGIISGVDVALFDSYYKLIQTDATINPGNSGGPLLNIKGELIGINSSKYAAVDIDNMGFAIPVDTVTYAISQYEKYGKILRPETGIVLDQSWEARIGLPTSKGLTVKSSENSLVKKGDTIVAVNGIEVHSIADWNEALKKTYTGDKITITISTDGKTENITI